MFPISSIAEVDETWNWIETTENKMIIEIENFNLSLSLTSYVNLDELFSKRAIFKSNKKISFTLILNIKLDTFIINWDAFCDYKKSKWF